MLWFEDCNICLRGTGLGLFDLNWYTKQIIVRLTNLNIHNKQYYARMNMKLTQTQLLNYTHSHCQVFHTTIKHPLIRRNVPTV